MSSGPGQQLDNDFIFLGRLGKGGFGEVIKVQSKVDGKLYAVKKIVLERNRPQDRKKITVEAQHLATLQHENVVRYFASWIRSEDIHDEQDTEGEDEYEEEEEDGSEDNDESSFSIAFVDGEDEGEEEEEDDSEDNDESSGSIAFVDSCRAVGTELNGNSSRRQQQLPSRACLCILMEYCESTLRAVLPKLPQDQKRMWRLFREIVEGLAHVHGHGLIHRDLKPDNIFLDSREHVKIGDFGLATSKVVRLQPEGGSGDQPPAESVGDASNTSYTFTVGTALYRAPELEAASGGVDRRRTYTNKVDLFSLGVIWFEMCCGAFSTGMGRIQQLRQVRKREIRIDEDVRQRLTDQQLQLLYQLLKHEPIDRPSCVELLNSDLLPSPPLEEARLKKIFQDTVLKPNTRRYTHMVDACFSQQATVTDDCAYDVQLGRRDVAQERAALSAVARHRLERLFQRHGAVPLSPPLLTVPVAAPADAAVRLMTGTGRLVELPRSQRRPLARLLARAGAGAVPLRHYSIERVYEERLPHGRHPRERQEALFGCVSAPSAALLADAELLSLVCELLVAFPTLASREYRLVVGHTLLLEAALETAGVPSDRRDEVLQVLCRQDCDTKTSQVQRQLEALGLSKKCVNQLWSRLELRGSLERVQQQFTSRRPSEAARQALRELAVITEFAEKLGVSGQMLVVHPGLVLGEDQGQFRGLVFQLQCPRRRGTGDVLAKGGRYDPLLAHYWSLLAPDGALQPAATAVSIAFDVLSAAAAREGRTASMGLPFEVVVAGGSDGPVARRQAAIARQLWTAGIAAFLYCGADSPAAVEEAARWAAARGARVLLQPEDSNSRMVRIQPLEARASAKTTELTTDLLGYLAKLGVCVERPVEPQAPAR